MASWALRCPNCNSAFAHAPLEDTFENFYLPIKPTFPSLCGPHLRACRKKSAIARRAVARLSVLQFRRVWDEQPSHKKILEPHIWRACRHVQALF